MPFTVLKISHVIEDRTDVVGEFPNEEEARRFVDVEERKAGLEGTGDDQEYMVEAPPPKID